MRALEVGELTERITDLCCGPATSPGGGAARLSDLQGSTLKKAMNGFVFATIELPGWMQVVIAISLFMAAWGTIWAKAFKPTYRFFELRPIMEDIASQFRTDSGSTLKDQMNRLEATAERLETAAVDATKATDDLRRDTRDALKALGQKTDSLRVKAGVAHDLAERDRIILDRMVTALHLIARDSDAASAASARLEQAAKSVASDLAASRKRADDAGSGVPGEAADAASQSPEP